MTRPRLISGVFFRPKIGQELVSSRSAKPTGLNSFCSCFFFLKGVMNEVGEGAGEVGEAQLIG